MKYQSQVTQNLVKEIIETGECELPTYEISAKLHRPMLEGFLQHLNSFSKESVEECPIT